MKFERLNTHILTIKEILNGEEMENVTNSIDYYFSDVMILDEEYFHIIAESPFYFGEYNKLSQCIFLYYFIFE